MWTFAQPVYAHVPTPMQLSPSLSVPSARRSGREEAPGASCARTFFSCIATQTRHPPRAVISYLLLTQ